MFEDSHKLACTQKSINNEKQTDPISELLPLMPKKACLS